ncbi:Gfo/Idh/MocA family oxidoreductase [Candidatus Hydrogenisulfobacillus filiaventi]|uniref:Gfo/Idh/MocA family oxidoreductase n=1 Tax=Candidatus Hydrogenisulfobacillus filiaventi TaxID=2707344 RepID=A0A6F8ZL43_9FIRM|nr:Gfo/Idh/MocA family oxidoreductase [Candidatus Hydrogenisulfobacillus filiaventi]
MERLGLGLVGCGKEGQRYLQALVHLPQARLAGAADADPERARAAALAFEVPAYASLEGLLADPAVQAVVVATPTGTHAPLAAAALEAGRPVLVEPPLALDYGEAARLVELAARRGLALAVSHHPRLLPPVQRLLQAAGEGRLGRLLLGEAVGVWPRPLSYYQEAPWRASVEAGGGVHLTQAVHFFDLLIGLFGPAAQVTALGATLAHALPVPDSLTAAVRFRSGALATLAFTTAAARVAAGERLTVIGSEGAAVVGPNLQELEAWRVPGDDEETVRQEMAGLPARSGWQGQWDALADFVEAVQEGRPPVLGADTTLEGVALIQAVTRAARQGRPVPLTEVSGA